MGYFGYIFGTSNYTGSYNANGYYIPSTLKEVSLTYPSTIVTSAFFNVSSVESLVIANSTAVIEAAALRGMSGLKSITLPFVGRLRSSTGSNGYFGYIFGTTSYTGSYNANGYYIPTLLENITITNEVSIVTSAFLNLSSVKSLYIDKTLNSIQSSALGGMSNLVSITLPFTGFDRQSTGSSAYFGYIFGTTNYSNSYSANGYYLPNTLKSVMITDTTQIPAFSFYGVREIESLLLPNTVIEIGESAFEATSKLNAIIIPLSVTTIGQNAFRDAIALTIYAEAASKPTGWSSSWNPNNRPVQWGYVIE